MIKAALITCFTGMAALAASAVAIVLQLDVTIVKALLIVFLALVTLSIIFDNISESREGKEQESNEHTKGL